MLFTQGKPYWSIAINQSVSDFIASVWTLDWDQTSTYVYFRYNSIQSPAVYGYKRNGDGFEFYVFKQRESYEAVSSFWGEKEPFLLK